MAEFTLAIIKPDAVAAGNTGKIIARLEEAGFAIRAMRMVRLTKEEAQNFYAVHRERQFFDSLTDFMTSGRVVPLCLEAENAVERLRTLMGATDPAKADDGTLRKAFATSIERNAIHGSDSPENARIELVFFFSALDICAD